VDNETAVRRMKTTSDVITTTAKPISAITPNRFITPPDAGTKIEPTFMPADPTS
jgi:hypothetical protein